MKKPPEMPHTTPLGPPNYTGPTGQITAETLALVAALQRIRDAIKTTHAPAERAA